MIATPQDQRRGKLVRRKGLEQLPDGLVLSVLHFSSDPDRGALIFASKAIATRLREERETLVAGLFSTDSGERLRAADPETTRAVEEDVSMSNSRGRTIMENHAAPYDAKVGQFHGPVARHQDVLALDVPVHAPVAVQVVQSRE